MASFTSYSYHISLLALTIFFVRYTSSSSSASPNNVQNNRFTKIFAFGDSYTDTGNTKSNSVPSGFMQATSYPYGMTHFSHPTNRYSNGRLVIDFVAEALFLPYTPPYLSSKADKFHGVNFAVAGATATDHGFFVENNLTLGLTPNSILTELAWFRKFLRSRGCQGTEFPECKTLMTNSLFWIGEIGMNDLVSNLGNTTSNTLIQKYAIDSITLFLKELLDMGAKYLVVQGAPPAGCLPLALVLASPDDRDTLGCVASLNNQTSQHNSQLQIRLKYLRRRYPDAIISYADSWNAYYNVVNNTKMYGITELFETCCGTGGPPYNFNISATCGSQEASYACPRPSEYINWDGFHLTENTHKVFTDLFLDGGYTNPPFEFLLSRRRREG